jgi:iron complex transport system ATP-binding protein
VSAPGYRSFDVAVVGIERLSPSFVRVTFSGHDLHDFGHEGNDQRFKILLPNALGGYPATDFSDIGWYAAWSALSEAERPPMRTYTVRQVRHVDGATLLDVDFVAHGDTGPASRWVNAASIGDAVKIIGPNAPTGGPWGGVAWNPPTDASLYILAGDETAAPAIAAVLESLPASARAHAFIEVPSAGDALPLTVPHGVSVTWLAREHRVHGDLLCAAVLAAMPGAESAETPADSDPEEPIWDVPDLDLLTGERLAPATTETYAWLAGESGVIKKLRRHLVQGAGIHKSRIAFMGYWREGATEN